MLELLKTLYVFQSLDLAFSRGGMCAVLAVVWLSEAGLFLFSPLPPLASSAKMAFLLSKHAFTAFEGLFLLMKRIRRPG